MLTHRGNYQVKFFQRGGADFQDLVFRRVDQTVYKIQEQQMRAFSRVVWHCVMLMNSHPHFPVASSPPLLAQGPDQNSAAPDSPLDVEPAATKLDKVAIVNALQLETTQCHTSHPSAVFGQICTAHAHKLPERFPSFRSKFWHHH